MRYSRLTINLDAEQIEQLNAIAREQGLSASALVRYAVAQMLSQRTLFLTALHVQTRQINNQQHVEVTR